MNEEFEQKAGGLELPILILLIITIILIGLFFAFNIFTNSQRVESENGFTDMRSMMDEVYKEVTKEPVVDEVVPEVPLVVSKALLNFSDVQPLSLSLKYPEGYVATKANGPLDSIKVTAVGDKVGRVEIFKKSAYQGVAVDFGAGTTQKEIDSVLPKERVSYGYNDDDSYVVRFFYSEGDGATRDELRAIVDSIVIN